MLLLGVSNTGTQTVLADAILNIGSVYRKYCKKNSCGFPTFSRTVNDISLNHSGIYHLTATFVVSAPTAGDVTVQLLVDGEVVDGAFATETITTATTEFRTMVIDRYVLVDKDCILGRESTIAKTISFQNTGVDATFTSVVVNIDKVVQLRCDMEERRIMAVRDGRNPYGSRGGYVSSRRPRRGRRDRGMDYTREDMRMRDYGDVTRRGRYGDYGYDMARGGRGGRGRDRRSDYGDYEMDGHHYLERQGSTYYPIQAMGTFEGYYGMPEQDYARGDMRGRGSRMDYGYDYASDYEDYGDYGETLSERELEEWSKKLLGQLDEREKQIFSKDTIMQKIKQMGKSMEGFGEKELYVAVLMVYTDYKTSIGMNPDLAIKLAYDWMTDKDVAVKGAEKLAVYYDCIVEGE